MRLLSDFDGVWTHPREEADSQGEVLDAALTELLPANDHAAARAWIASARAGVAAEPQIYGWAPGGRLSAFGDEDPFAPHSGLLHFIHANAPDDAMAMRLRDAVHASPHRTLEAFGGWCHGEGVRRVVAARGPAILPEAAAVAPRLLEVMDVVVVSNSSTGKLSEWFGHAGVPATVHPDASPGRLRIRGAARKFELAPANSERLALGAMHVEIARPVYRDTLDEERPDAVVGDVFSIDLALPLALRRSDPSWKHVRLFWIVRDYTPAWLRRTLAEFAPEVEPIEDGVPGMVRALGA